MDVDASSPVNTVTGKILRSAFTVSNTPGCGFLEKVYENALIVELRDEGLPVLQQARIEIQYRGKPVGDYVADLIVAGRVIVEIRALRGLEHVHRSQVINYLRATRLPVGLLLNFGLPRLEYERFMA